MTIFLQLLKAWVRKNLLIARHRENCKWNGTASNTWHTNKNTTEGHTSHNQRSLISPLPCRLDSLKKFLQGFQSRLLKNHTEKKGPNQVIFYSWLADHLSMLCDWGQLHNAISLSRIPCTSTCAQRPGCIDSEVWRELWLAAGWSGLFDACNYTQCVVVMIS